LIAGISNQYYIPLLQDSYNKSIVYLITIA